MSQGWAVGQRVHASEAPRVPGPVLGDAGGTDAPWEPGPVQASGAPKTEAELCLARVPPL